METPEYNPADALLAAYERADGLAAWNFEMIHRCRLTKGATPAQVLAASQEAFDRQFDYAFYFPKSSYRPPLPFMITH